MASGRVDAERPEWLDSFPTRHYLTRDTIQNLGIYVKLVRVLDQDGRDVLEVEDEEDGVFTWQEKGPFCPHPRPLPPLALYQRKFCPRTASCRAWRALACLFCVAQMIVCVNSRAACP